MIVLLLDQIKTMTLINLKIAAMQVNIKKYKINKTNKIINRK